jgi:hypothetical protein
MALYLQMDGVDDRLSIPSTVSFKDSTEFEVDFRITLREDWHQIVNFGGKTINFSSNTTNIAIHADFQDVFVDEVKVTSGTPFLTVGQRHTMRGVLKSGISTGTSGIHVFNNSVAQYLQGAVYFVKIYQNGVLKSHIDMSSGNVNDISGNGNHATLTGGTWLDDGTGGGDAGTEVSTSYLTKNVIYRTSSNNYDSKQHLYQSLISDVITKQSLYKTDSLVANTKQSIFKTSTNFYDTLIDIYNTSVTKIDKFSLKVQIYKQESNNYSLIQRLFKEVAEVKATVHNHIFAEGTSNLDTKQIVMKLHSVHHTLKQAFYESNQTDYDTLQQLLSDWNEYRQVVEFILSITTKKNESIEITQRKNFNLNI